MYNRQITPSNMYHQGPDQEEIFLDTVAIECMKMLIDTPEPNKKIAEICFNLAYEMLEERRKYISK